MKRFLIWLTFLLVLMGEILSNFVLVEASSQKLTITYFVTLDSKAAQFYTSYNSLPIFQTLEKKYKVDIKFIHPPATGFSDQLNLMIASKKLTDVIEMNLAVCKMGGD